MKLFALGEIEWDQTQLLYHAMGHLGLEGVVVCRSRTPYFCVGFHQAVDQELDIDHLSGIDVPYFRRETGGGTVRLDRDQVYYQVIMHRDNPAAPVRPDYFCERYLGPAVEALAELGLKGQMVPPNDILVDDRKISGNGGGQLGDCKVLVGDLLVDYDPEPMCMGLKVPSETFRKVCIKSMRNNITTVRDKRPGTSVEEVEEAIISAYAKICDEGEGTSLPSKVHEKADELKDLMLSRKWLFHPGPNRPARRVKIREGVHLAALDIGGIGWLQVEVSEGSLKDAQVISRSSDTIKEVQNALKGLLGEDDLVFKKGLKRTIQEMGLSADWVETIVNQVIERLEEK